MLTKVAAVATATILAAAPMAMANSFSEGTIKSIDPAMHQLTLQDGTTYQALPSAHLSHWSKGEKVDLNYTYHGSGPVIEWIRPAA